MSSTEQPRDRRVRRSINPATASVEELLAHVATDPVSGLSQKEAERRLENSTALPLFRKQRRSFASCVRQTVREPALWLMLAVALISLFFDRVLLGLVCLALTAGNTALCAYFLYRADGIDAAMQVYDTPLCRVIRGGRTRRISADALVKGDILFLRKGDIVPADCRLLKTAGFAVCERELEASAQQPTVVRLEKDADAFPESSAGYRLSPVNMVFAGGMVEEGSAMAVAVAVGSESHLGGLMGHVPSPHRGRAMECLKKSSKVLSVYNLCLFCLIVPVIVVGIFTVGEKYEFLDIFLSVLALTTVTLSEHLLAKGAFVAAASRQAAATDRDVENTAEIKSATAPEKLTAMTDLLLIGTAALHDGERHPQTLQMGDTLYRCDRPEADEEVKAAAEYLYLYRIGMGSGEADARLLGLLDAFCDWAEIDRDALQVKIKGIRTEQDGVSGIFPTVDGNRRIAVRLTNDFASVEACTRFCDGRRIRPLDRDGINLLYRAYREAVRRGTPPLFLLTVSGNETTVRAMLTYAPHICRKTAGCIKNLESAGIRVAAFLRDVSDGHAHVLAACGLTEKTVSDHPSSSEDARIPAVQRLDEGCRAFEGCSEAYMLDCITALKARGRTVGVLSVDERDISLLAEADVAFTCSPSMYETADADTNTPFRADGISDGLPDSRTANDRSRRAAHVLVRRTSAVGGGVLGVLRALQAADGIKSTLDRTLRFTMLSQAIRAMMVILPLCMGLSITATPIVLLSGLLLDLLVMTAALHFPLEHTPTPRQGSTAWLSRPHVTHRAELFAIGGGVVIAWAVAGIAALYEAEFGGDLLYYSLLCTFGLQAAVFLTDRLPRRDSIVFFTALAFGLAYVGALAASLVGGLVPLWSLLMPLVAPASYVAFRLLFCRFLKKPETEGTPRL
jgi:hypothetical protein